MAKWFDMRKILLMTTFFIATPLMIFFSIFYLSYLLTVKDGQILGASSSTGIAYAALPPADEAFSATLEQEDSQTEIVRQFLEKHNSPLEPYAPDIVVAAKRYELDFRLLPAIAMQESNLCKKVPLNSNNCWGWGIYGGKVTRFNNYPEAIETISKTLSTKYRDKGLVTPFEIGQLYNPSNTNNWAEKVSHFMSELQ